MTETPESRTEPTAVATERQPAERPPRWEDRPNRLNQILAWVGIVAGVVFIVAAVFFSGFFIGRNSGGYDWNRMHPYGGQSPMGPGMMGPGQTGPGGMMGPGQQSPTTTPTSPRP
jgi:hypothetical protein